MTWTMEDFYKQADSASVNIAAGPAYLHTGNILPPRLWDDLRQEMQKRLRRATGEPHAIVTFEFGTEVRT